MGKLAKSLKNSKILNGTRYAEQNWEVRGTPWGKGGLASFPHDKTFHHTIPHANEKYV